MFGWEFPPFNQGGLGTACEGLVKNLTKQGVEVTLVLPILQESNIPNCKIVSPCLEIVEVGSPLRAYHTPDSYFKLLEQSSFRRLYGQNLFAEVNRYAESIGKIVEETTFDVIHAHDWLTFKAGLNAKRISGKPLLVHVHATEFDRTGGNGLNQYIYNIEKEGLEKSDQIITVSNFTKNKLVQHYGTDNKKIHVVHNGVDLKSKEVCLDFHKTAPTVLFLGRITLQKGPDYFIKTAKKVLEYHPQVNFVIAGKGDMEGYLVEQVASWDLGDKILFTGWLQGEEIDRAYKMADLYVMPSVSEPFGITPLEAMRNGTPVLISKQSGVSEVINHCLKTDFWDIDESANKIISILQHQELKKEISLNGKKEVSTKNWAKPAKLCKEIYKNLARKEVKING